MPQLTPEKVRFVKVATGCYLLLWSFVVLPWLAVSVAWFGWANLLRDPPGIGFIILTIPLLVATPCWIWMDFKDP